MAENRNYSQEKEHRKRDYVVFFIVAFVLIFLTSSFVIENVYDSADNLAVSPEGVTDIYLAATGSDVFGKAAEEAEAKKKEEEKKESEEKDTSTKTVQDQTGTTKTDN